MSVATPIPIADGELKRIPLEQLVESPLNPRRHYDPAALDELATSLATSGQVTPVLVRPTMGGKKFELAAGHRRYRAAQQAKLPALLAVVRELDEAAFLEVLTVENLQRDDLDPLEEAAGFRTLMTSAGYDVAKLAQRCGRSTRYVYDRLKLLQLTAAAQDLLRTGRITLEHAIILARLSADDQTQVIGDPDSVGLYRSGSGLFAQETSLWSPHRDEDEEQTNAADPWDGCKVVSPKELQAYIDRHVRFDAARDPDPMLFPETAQALDEAEASDMKVIPITYEYVLPASAKAEGVRTYGSASWKRADGERGSKTCDASAKLLGIVVAGPDRGQAFRVCTAKKTCKVHWAAEIRAAARNAKSREQAASTEGPRKATAAEIPPELKRTWFEETLAAMAPHRIIPMVLANRAELDHIGDEYIWNFAAAMDEGRLSGWAKAGKPVPYNEGINYEVDDLIDAAVCPALPGKFKPARYGSGFEFQDIGAARSAVALLMWKARVNAKAFDREFDQAIVARQKAYLAEQTAAAKSKQPKAAKASKKSKKAKAA